MPETNIFEKVLTDEARYLSGQTGLPAEAAQAYLLGEQAYLVAKGLALPLDATPEAHAAFAEQMDSIPDEEVPVIDDDEMLAFIIEQTGLEPEIATILHDEEINYLEGDIDEDQLGEEDGEEDAEEESEEEDAADEDDEGGLMEIDEEDAAGYMSQVTGLSAGKCFLFLYAEQEFYVKNGLAPASDSEEDIAAYEAAQENGATAEDFELSELLGYIEGRTGLSREETQALSDAESEYLEDM